MTQAFLAKRLKLRTPLRKQLHGELFDNFESGWRAPMSRESILQPMRWYALCSSATKTHRSGNRRLDHLNFGVIKAHSVTSMKLSQILRL